MVSGTSISNGNDMDEFPNQSTPKASICDQSNQIEQLKRDSIEKAHENSFANISMLNVVNESHTKKLNTDNQGSGAGATVVVVEKTTTSVKLIAKTSPEKADDQTDHYRTATQPLAMNLADEYFVAKQNKLNKTATAPAEIVIRLDNPSKSLRLISSSSSKN